METIADHDLAPRQGRKDDAVEMIGARRHMRQSLRPQGKRRLVEQDQFAQGLGPRRATGLASEEYFMPCGNQGRVQEAGLGGFPRPFAALEGDEQPAHASAMGRGFGAMAQSCKGPAHQPEARHSIGGDEIEADIRHPLILEHKRTDRLSGHDRGNGG